MTIRQEIGLNMPKFKKDLVDKDKIYDAMIDRDIKVGAEKRQTRRHTVDLSWWLVANEADHC